MCVLKWLVGSATNVIRRGHRARVFVCFFARALLNPSMHCERMRTCLDTALICMYKYLSMYVYKRFVAQHCTLFGQIPRTKPHIQCSKDRKKSAWPLVDAAAISCMCETVPEPVRTNICSRATFLMTQRTCVNTFSTAHACVSKLACNLAFSVVKRTVLAMNSCLRLCLSSSSSASCIHARMLLAFWYVCMHAYQCMHINTNTIQTLDLIRQYTNNYRNSSPNQAVAVPCHALHSSAFSWT